MPFHPNRFLNFSSRKKLPKRQTNWPAQTINKAQHRLFPVSLRNTRKPFQNCRLSPIVADDCSHEDPLCPNRCLLLAAFFFFFFSGFLRNLTNSTGTHSSYSSEGNTAVLMSRMRSRLMLATC